MYIWFCSSRISSPKFLLLQVLWFHLLWSILKPGPCSDVESLIFKSRLCVCCDIESPIHFVAKALQQLGPKHLQFSFIWLIIFHCKRTEFKYNIVRMKVWTRARFQNGPQQITGHNRFNHKNIVSKNLVEEILQMQNHIHTPRVLFKENLSSYSYLDIIIVMYFIFDTPKSVNQRELIISFLPWHHK